MKAENCLMWAIVEQQIIFEVDSQKQKCINRYQRGSNESWASVKKKRGLRLVRVRVSEAKAA